MTDTKKPKTPAKPRKRKPKVIAEAPAAPPRTEETWLREDWKTYERLTQYCASRQVSVALVCNTCKEVLNCTTVNAAGDYLVTCQCAVRRWARWGQ